MQIGTTPSVYNDAQVHALHPRYALPLHAVCHVVFGGIVYYVFPYALALAGTSILTIVMCAVANDDGTSAFGNMHWVRIPGGILHMGVATVVDSCTRITVSPPLLGNFASAVNHEPLHDVPLPC